MRNIMHKHTPGPWYIGKDFSDQGRHIYAEQMVCDDEGESWHPLIATTDDDERLVDWQANAVLIAAAPDLLGALETLVNMAESFPSELHKDHPDVVAAHAAIAKATATNQ
jgi:hypothetical protein